MVGFAAARNLDFFCRVLESHTIPFIDCEVGLYRIHDDNLSLKKTTSGFQATQTAVASQFLICKKYGLTLKDSPFEAHVSFQFDGVRILLVHPNEPLGLIIEEEFARFKVEPDDVSPAARFEVRAGSALPAPQKGAIRTRYWEEFKSYEYRLGEIRFELFQENYFWRKRLFLDAHPNHLHELGKLRRPTGRLGLQVARHQSA